MVQIRRPELFLVEALLFCKQTMSGSPGPKVKARLRSNGVGWVQQNDSETGRIGTFSKMLVEGNEVFPHGRRNRLSCHENERSRSLQEAISQQVSGLERVQPALELEGRKQRVKRQAVLTATGDDADLEAARRRVRSEEALGDGREQDVLPACLTCLQSA
jgi:hypothetical protein